MRLGLRLDRLEHGEDREAALVQEVRAHVEQVGQVAHAPRERGVGVGRVARRVARLAEARARAAARDSTGRGAAGRGAAGREEPQVVDDGSWAVRPLGVEEDGELAWFGLGT